MKESYGEGPATHTGPESCGATRKGGDEALTGGSAGRVFSRVRNSLRDADAVKMSGRPHPGRRYRQAPGNPARSETPRTHGRASHGNREVPGSPRTEDVWGRSGKSKDTRR
jgi:RNA-directed DNA polymerase